MILNSATINFFRDGKQNKQKTYLQSKTQITFPAQIVSVFTVKDFCQWPWSGFSFIDIKESILPVKISYDKELDWWTWIVV